MFPLRDLNPNRKFPVVVVGLIVVNILIFFYENTLQESYQVGQLFNTYGFVPDMAVRHFWSCVTAIFLHGSWAHLLGNMWFLWLFGDNVEDEMGHGWFLGFYFFCGILANFAHYLSGPSSLNPVVGASGAIAGVMGAYLLLFRHARILTYIPPFFFFPIPAWIYLIFWFFLQISSGAMAVYGGAEEGIAFWAHVGGFAAGMILYRLFMKDRNLPGKEQY